MPHRTDRDPGVPVPGTPPPGFQARHARGGRRLTALYAGLAVAVVAVAAGAVSLVGRGDGSAPGVSDAAQVVAPAVTAGAAGPPGSPGPSAGGSPAATDQASVAPSKAAPSRAVPSKAAPSVSATTAAAPAQETSSGGWVAVDQAAWQKQLSAYRSMKFDAVPAGVGDKAEFRADCAYSHRLADDPIVLPGLPGASHMHSFVGNKAVDATTTAGDLTKFTATTCKPVLDHSAYWVPTLYDNATGKPVETTGFRVYYRSIRSNSTGVVPLPNGLRMVAGDAKKKVPTPRGAQGQFYCAFYGPGDLDGVARSTNGNWPICGEPATLHFMLQFPDCWDGKHLDSPNHKDHLAFGSDAGCPAEHPVRVPALTFDIQYGAKGTPAGYYLSSDKAGKSASSMHGDAFVMWDAATMNSRTKNCVLHRKTCDNNGFEK